MKNLILIYREQTIVQPVHPKVIPSVSNNDNYQGTQNATSMTRKIST